MKFACFSIITIHFKYTVGKIINQLISSAIQFQNYIEIFNMSNQRLINAGELKRAKRLRNQG